MDERHNPLNANRENATPCSAERNTRGYGAATHAQTPALALRARPPRAWSTGSTVTPASLARPPKELPRCPVAPVWSASTCRPRHTTPP
eukprot:4564552-Lingulodinium_polyedra.AAC.1